MNSQENATSSTAKPRTTYEVAAEVAGYAPDGGDIWQNTGVKQVPVRLLTELREAVERERRVKVAWQAAEIPPGNGIVTDWPPFEEADEFIAAVREWRGECVEVRGTYTPPEDPPVTGGEFAGAWRFNS